MNQSHVRTTAHHELLRFLQRHCMTSAFLYSLRSSISFSRLSITQPRRSSSDLRINLLSSFTVRFAPTLLYMYNKSVNHPFVIFGLSDRRSVTLRISQVQAQTLYESLPLLRRAERLLRGIRSITFRVPAFHYAAWRNQRFALVRYALHYVPKPFTPFHSWHYASIRLQRKRAVPLMAMNCYRWSSTFSRSSG